MAQDLSTPDSDAEAWVRTTLAAMSLEQRVGQLLMPAIPWTAPSSAEAMAEFERHVAELGIGCFTLRVRSAREAIAVINTLQAASEIPLLINVNFERGTGTFWPEGTFFPRQMALAATGDSETARVVGALTAREGRACGVHWAFVPICDVNINPENPIINIRSYGEDVETVSRFATAFIEGCEGNGMLACAKHFPGHGDTSTDSHLELAVVESDRDRLESVEFPPFRAAIAAGVGSVMTSHIWFPALMGEEGQIAATVSRNVLTGLLREEMGFGGLIVTDAMTMRGITNHLSPGEAAVAAVTAGADVILDSPDVPAAHAGLVEAVRRGALPEDRIAESVERILRAKAQLGLRRWAPLDPELALAALRRPDAIDQARDMARRAITVVRDEQSLLPLSPDSSERVLHIALYDEWPRWEPEALRALTAGLQARFAHVEGELVFQSPNRAMAERFAGIHEDMTESEIEQHFGLPPDRRHAILAQSQTADVTLVTAFVRTASYKGTIGLGEDQISLLQQLTQSGRALILVVLGSPYLLTAVPEVPCQMLTYDTSHLFTEALAGALAGEFPLSGRLPVSLPGLAQRGHGLQIPRRDSITD